MILSTDEPKSLRDEQEREARLDNLELHHIRPLTVFVREIREHFGPEYHIPFFDPYDGGSNAECLFLLEAPGPKAVATGFISRNNPDETAKNFFILNKLAGIDRRRTAIWNVVPWYVGNGQKIRPVNANDLRMAEPALLTLIRLLPRLRIIVLVGGKASTAKGLITRLAPTCHVFTMPHPSPMFVNRSACNRSVILEALQSVSNALINENYRGLH